MKGPSGNHAESPSAIQLSVAHRGALSSHFKTVEEYLRVVAAWIDGFEGIFYGAATELPEEHRERARVLIGEVFDGLGQIRRELDIERRQISSIGVMRAYLSELWVSLVETRSHYLRGYGEVPQQLAEYLDRRVGELESQVNEIRRLVETGKPDAANSASGAVSGISKTVSERPAEPPEQPR